MRLSRIDAHCVKLCSATWAMSNVLALSLSLLCPPIAPELAVRFAPFGLSSPTWRPSTPPNVAPQRGPHGLTFLLRCHHAAFVQGSPTPPFAPTLALLFVCVTPSHVHVKRDLQVSTLAPLSVGLPREPPVPLWQPTALRQSTMVPTDVVAVAAPAPSVSHHLDHLTPSTIPAGVVRTYAHTSRVTCT